MFQSQSNHPGGSAQSAHDRLDSWKEIAAYLRRDVSTLHRWEKKEGLPVHRHLHRSGPTVYAYRSELDAWWESRSGRVKISNAGQKNWLSSAWPRLALAGILFAVLLGFWMFRGGVGQTLPFDERDWVLISTFDNRTGEPLFDGTLEYALERELSSSRHVNVVPRPRINDTLRLMKKPPGTPLDHATGREVCLRDGGIRAMLEGRIAKIDSGYLLSLYLTNPADGMIVATENDQAGTEAEVLPAVRRLSSWVREALGENLASIRKNEEQLARVTTPSLKALQLFTKADTLERQAVEDLQPAKDQHAVVAELLRSALIEDPGFAAAHTWLAWALRNCGEPRDVYVPHAKRGFDLASQVSERERYIIQGSYYLLTQRWKDALPIWNALLTSYPEDYWGNNNIGAVYAVTERFEELTNWEVNRAKLRPNDFLSVARGAWVSVEAFSDLERARPLAARALDLGSSVEDPEFDYLKGWLYLFPSFEKWTEDSLEQAIQLGQDARKSIISMERGLGEVSQIWLCRYYLTLGQLDEARRTCPVGQIHECDCAFLALTSDTRKASRQVDSSPCELSLPFGAITVARLGNIEQANRILSEHRGRWPTPLDLVVEGELARLTGQSEAASKALESGLEILLTWRIPRCFFLASESLASIYEQQGKIRKAAEVLETASATRTRTGFLAGAFWVRNQWLLAQLYRRSGDLGRASGIEEELRSLLRYADPDHPIVKGLAELKD